MNVKLIILMFLCIYLPLFLLAQEEIEINVIDQFHYDNMYGISGLTFDGEYLWMPDSIRDSLVAVDQYTGEKVLSFPYPPETGLSYICSLSYDGENLWASIGSHLYKISHNNGSLIESFTIPYSTGSDINIWGITWYNGYLYCSISDDSSNLIIGIDVETTTCIDTLEIDDSILPGGLTNINGHFWLYCKNENKVLKLNHETGQSEGWFPHHYFCGSNIGLTTDGEYMYCSDGSRNIYKYEILENPADENIIQPHESKIQISAYPNPFNPEIRIEFELMENSKTNLDIYNAKGQKVQSIENNKILVAGNHNYIWNADNIASGIYFIRLSTQYGHSDKKITILK